MKGLASPTDKKEIDLLEYGRIVIKRKGVLVTFAAVLIALAAVLSFTKKPLYRALIVIALGCGLVASIGISQVMENRASDAPAVLPTYKIYVAVADLIPGLHRRPELRATLQQVSLITLGIGSVWLLGYLAHGH